MTECGRSRERIARASDRRLALEEQFELEEHARACARCRGELERARRIEHALAALPAPPLDRLDVERSLARIHERLAAEPRAARPPRARRVAALALAAATLVALTSLAWLAATRRGASTPGESERGALAVSPPSATTDVPNASSEVPGGTPELPGATSDVPRAADAEGAPLARAGAIEKDAREVASGVTADAAPDADPSAWVTDFDGARHEWARAEVARILREAQGDAPSDAARFLEAFDERARSLALAGWPVLRIAQGLVTSAEIDAARAAMRYVGLRGDKSALRELGRILGDAERREIAARALASAGAAGLQELAAVPWDPALAPIVADALDRAGAEDALAWTESVLRAARRERADGPRTELARALLERLPPWGTGAAPLALALADHPWLAREAVLDVFVRCEGASALLAERVHAARSAVEEDLLLDAIARLTPPDCYAWVARRAASARASSAAMRALACYPGEAAVLELLALRASGSRDGEAAELDAWKIVLDRDAARVAKIAGDAWLVTDAWQLHRLLETLVLTEHPGAVPALLELARREALDDEDHQRAVLAVGEIGGADDVAALAELVALLDARESRTAAGAFWAAHALGGEAGVRALVGGGDAGVLPRVLELVTSPRSLARPTSTLLQLARAVEPWLERRDPIAKDLR